MSVALAGDVAVLIVNYGTFDLTLEAISSVLELNQGDIEIHVVDNASPRGDAKILGQEIERRHWTPRVVLHEEYVNHGFGRANNLVLSQLARRSSPPKYVFLLNPDASLVNDALSELAGFLDAHPAVGAVGARIVTPNGEAVTGAFRFPGIISTFEEAIALGPVSRVLAPWRVPMAPDLETSQVDWVVGAAVMLRLNSVRELGFFDPHYFLYYEEVDLMKAMSRHGIEVWHVAEAIVMHREGAATGVRSGEQTKRRRPTYWYGSWQYYFVKNHGRLVTLAAVFAWIIGTACNQVVSFARRRTPASPPNFYSDVWTLVALPVLSAKERQDKSAPRQ